MKRLLCLAAMVTLVAFFSSAVFAADPAADADVKGLWIKATNLPSTVFLEDMTQDADTPYFIYSFEGNDGDGPTIAVERAAQGESQQKILALDKKFFIETFMSQSEAETVKDLKFEEAEALSAKFSYPCQIATFTNEEMNEGATYLFIQTDPYLFTVHVTRILNNKKYGEADVETWLNGFELVEQ
jgi:hypothetical protein